MGFNDRGGHVSFPSKNYLLSSAVTANKEETHKTVRQS